MSEELPAGWITARLDEIADVRLGRQRSPKNHAGDDMRPYLRAANVGWQGLRLDDVKKMNFTNEEASTYRLEPGDIVMSEASGSAGEVGKPAIWKGEIDDCCFQNTLIRIRSRGVEPLYLLHLIRYEALCGAFIENSRGVGIYHVGAAKISSWPVPLAPLAEQLRIVEALEDHLSRLDAARIYTSHAQQSVTSFDSASQRGLLDPWLGSTRKLKDLLASPLINGRSVQTDDDGFPVLRLTALKGRTLDLSARKGGAWTQEDATPFLVERGDFMVSRGNGSLHLVGRGALVPDVLRPVAFPDTMIRVRPNLNLIHPEFLAFAWNSRFIRRQLEAAARTTAGIYKVNQSILEALDVPLPSPEEQIKIITAASSHFETVKRLENAVSIAKRRAEHLRRSLLAEAFAGRLVPQNPADEPASVLLKRIEAEREKQPKPNRARKSPSAGKSLTPPKQTSVIPVGVQEELPL